MHDRHYAAQVNGGATLVGGRAALRWDFSTDAG
jgi:hypothetical protein